MIHAETVDGRIRVKCGQASGMDLICEAAALVTSVVRAVSSHEDNKDIVDEEVAKTAFRYIFTGACAEIEEKTGVDVSTPFPKYDDDDTDDDDEDDSEETVIVKAIPKDSETGRKLMELLGIDSDEAKPKDDETKDDIPKYLF